MNHTGMRRVKSTGSLPSSPIITEEKVDLEPLVPLSCHLLFEVIEKKPTDDYEDALFFFQHADAEAQEAHEKLQRKQAVFVNASKVLENSKKEVTVAQEAVAMAILALEKANMDLHHAKQFHATATQEEFIASKKFLLAKLDHAAAQQNADLCLHKLEHEKKKLGI
jgi:hypothetical protein